MTEISGRAAVTQAALINKESLAGRSLSGTGLDRHEGAMAKLEAAQKTPEEQARQLNRQAQVEAHTVYREDGKLIAAHYADGTTTFGRNADGATGLAARESGHAQGLHGARLNDHIAERIAEDLREKYGGALEVQRFSEGNAPTQGELSVEFSSANSRMELLAITNPGIIRDPEAFAILLGAQEN